ncbi:hypothetical protein LP420_39935 [Massilia sp. B-10]|nr:hypothetical protein LP420_39935 [Massilia sp. B-10]
MQFAHVHGDGKINGQEGSVVVNTDARGMATVNVTLAKKTDVNPHYIEADQGDQYATRISVNEVEVSVETANGGLSIETPFSAVAKPGALARFESPEVVEPVIGIVGMGADVVTLKLVDENGNPLANITTSYTINTEMTCTSDKAGTYFKFYRSVRRVFRHQWRHDRLRHQVADSGRLRFADTHDQEPFGWRCLSTGLILGNAIAANTTVTANAKGLSRVQVPRWRWLRRHANASPSASFDRDDDGRESERSRDRRAAVRGEGWQGP